MFKRQTFSQYKGGLPKKFTWIWKQELLSYLLVLLLRSSFPGKFVPFGHRVNEKVMRVFSTLLSYPEGKQKGKTIRIASSYVLHNASVGWRKLSDERLSSCSRNWSVFSLDLSDKRSQFWLKWAYQLVIDQLASMKRWTAVTETSFLFFSSRLTCIDTHSWMIGNDKFSTIFIFTIFSVCKEDNLNWR